MTRVATVPASTRPERSTPLRALLASLLALAVPVAATKWAQSWVETDGALLVWLPALLPAFLLAYYRGWSGASLALAGGMATLVLTQVETLLLGLETPPWPFLLGVVVLLAVVAIGAGWVTELLHREREVAERAALTDVLTGLPNRRHASVFLEAAWGAALRGRSLIVVLFDIDRFKLVNDLCGHAAGDRVLQELADVLRHRTRRMDLSARFGGEEFLSVLSDCSLADGVEFAEVVRASISSVDFGWGRVTVSAGVSTAVSGMGSPDVLVATADRALYQAKEGGRNQVVCADLARFSATAAPSPDHPPRATPTDLEGLQVVLVDDDELTLRIATRVLERLGCIVRATPSARQALSMLTGSDHVDVVVTDIVMPEMSGFTLVDQASRFRPELPVVFISGYPKAEVYWGGMPGVRSAFMAKPPEAGELRETLLSLLSPEQPEGVARPVTAVRPPGAPPGVVEPADIRTEILRRLALVAEYRHDITGRHADRVGLLSSALATELGLPPAEADLIRRAAPLHDVGKIGVPDAILRKPGPLTPEETAIVRGHTTIGAEILGGSPHRILDVARTIAVSHHERWDGSGYPEGRAGADIPQVARIVAVADAFDTITHERAYEPAASPAAAFEEIGRCRGSQFDPEVVDALRAIVGRLGLDRILDMA